MLHFDQNQREQLRELLSEEYDGLWNELLYGIAGGSGDLVAVALSQVGQVGGEPYWSWYGFGSRVEWCACFVSWCAGQCGLLENGVIPKFASCGAGVNWFQSRGQWLDGSATPEPGWSFSSSGTAAIPHRRPCGHCGAGGGWTGLHHRGKLQQHGAPKQLPVGYGEIKGYG